MKTPILVVFSLIGCGALAATALIPIVSPPISFTARRVQGQGQGQGRSPQGGPPPAVFRTEVPESELNVIAGSPTKTGITLTVLAKSSGNGKVTVDAAGKGVTVLDFGVESGIAKAVKIDGLRSGMEYSYNIQVVSDVKTSKFAGKFTTAKSPGQEFSFVVQADSHLDGNSDTAVYNRTLHNMVQDRPDFLVDLGDTFMVDK